MAGGSGATHNIDDLHHEGNWGMGNLFLEESNDLLLLDTKYIVESVAGTVMKVKTIGHDQNKNFFD